MKKVLLGAVVLTALVGEIASAADLPRPVPVYRAPPAVVPYFTWTGCHIGGNGGGVWVHKEWSNSVASPAFTVSGIAIPAAPGGVAFGTHTASGAPVGTTSEQRAGWTVGVGGEYAFLDFLTGFVEYDFYGFGTTTNNFNCTLAGCVSVFLPVDIKENKNVIKVGLNFKFGPTAPEVARY